mgnify:CR=1 FL=1
MAEYTITISDNTKKSKYLLGLIKEMAKNEKSIKISKTPNDETEKAINDSLNGFVIKTKNKDDFFNKLED